MHLDDLLPARHAASLRQEASERGGEARGESEHVQQREDHPRDRQHRAEPHQSPRIGRGSHRLRRDSEAQSAQPARVQGPRHQRDPEGRAGRAERELRRADLLRSVREGAGDRPAARRTAAHRRVLEGERALVRAGGLQTDQKADRVSGERGHGHGVHRVPRLGSLRVLLSQWTKVGMGGESEE